MLSYNIRTMKMLPLLFSVGSHVSALPVQARQVSKIGVHILHADETDEAKDLVALEDHQDEWHYVTIPFTVADSNRPEHWQRFLNQAREEKLIPIMRLATTAKEDYWEEPTRHDIVKQINVLAKLKWPTEDKYIVILNEVNHAKEWGGKLDPEGYARLFRFASSWAKTTDENFVVLPAAMDLAAPNGANTMEAFAFLNRMHKFDNEIFSYADAWNSHSYPNPGFAAAPNRKAKNALNGFEYELAYLKDKTGKNFKVFITETGWEQTRHLQYFLPAYYSYALARVWSHPDVVAVTPFILKGAPGPFAGFSFLDENNNPTVQYRALRLALEKVYGSGTAAISQAH